MVTARDPAAAFRARDDLPAIAERTSTLVWARNAWFRIAALGQCRYTRRTTAELLERNGVVPTTSSRRVMLRNLSNLVRGGFMDRTDDGYRTTQRGKRVLADLAALSLDRADRPV